MELHYSIKSLSVDKDDYVTTAKIAVVGILPTTSSVKVIKELTFDKSSDTSITDFEKLTKEQVIGWLLEQYSEEQLIAELESATAVEKFPKSWTEITNGN